MWKRGHPAPRGGGVWGEDRGCNSGHTPIALPADAPGGALRSAPPGGRPPLARVRPEPSDPHGRVGRDAPAAPSLPHTKRHHRGRALRTPCRDRRRHRALAGPPRPGGRPDRPRADQPGEHDMEREIGASRGALTRRTARLSRGWDGARRAPATPPSSTLWATLPDQAARLVLIPQRALTKRLHFPFPPPLAQRAASVAVIQP